MNKLIFPLSLLLSGLACADSSSPISSSPITSDKGIVNGLYKSVKSNTFIKIGNSDSNGLTIPAASHKTQPLSAKATPSAVSFDERLYFSRVNSTTYTSKHSDSACVATLKKVGPNSFVVMVNSVAECFNKHSQFNAEVPESDQSRIFKPYKDVEFKLDTNPLDVKYFENFN